MFYVSSRSRAGQKKYTFSVLVRLLREITGPKVLRGCEYYLNIIVNVIGKLQHSSCYRVERTQN